jgi:hypothetical protein
MSKFGHSVLNAWFVINALIFFLLFLFFVLSPFFFLPSSLCAEVKAQGPLAC